MGKLGDLFNFVIEGSQMARDARIGAAGALQVRDLYSEGKTEEAKDLAKTYTVANTIGVTAGAAGASGLAGITAFKASHPLLYLGIKTGIDSAFTIDGIRNTFSNNGVQKTYNIGKDIYQNELTRENAFDFTKSLAGDALDIVGGVEFGKAAKAAKVYTKGVKSRATESLLRMGDKVAQDVSTVINQPINLFFRGSNFPNLKELFFNKNTINYIFDPYADKSLAYKLPIKYSGTGWKYDAHEGDIIDVFMGKTDKLKAADGKTVIGEVARNLSFVPDVTKKTMRLSFGISSPRVLRAGPGYFNQTSEFMLNQGFSKSRPKWKNIDEIIDNKEFNKEFRTNSDGITITKGIDSLDFVDPGRYGITAFLTDFGPVVVGNDVYHYTPKKLILDRVRRKSFLSKFIPNITIGDPLIVQWPIGKPYPKGITFNKQGGKMNYLNYLRTTNKIDISAENVGKWAGGAVVTRLSPFKQDSSKTSELYLLFDPTGNDFELYAPNPQEHSEIELEKVEVPAKTTATKPGSWKEFRDTLIAALLKKGFTGESAQTLVAQMGLETGHGKHMSGDYNYGNITAGKNWSGKTVLKVDNHNGKTYSFRSYDDLDLAMNDYVNLLTRSYGVTPLDTKNQIYAKLTGGNLRGRKWAEAQNYTQNIDSVYNMYWK